MKIDTAKIEVQEAKQCAAADLSPRRSSYNDVLNPLRWASRIWTGSSTADSITSEERLLKRFVRSPHRLGRVAIDVSQIGLGTQHINTLEVNPEAGGTPLVWAHGAGSGLGFFYRNYDAMANPPGRSKRRVLAFDWLGQAGSSRPSYPTSGLRPGWTLSERTRVDAALKFGVESLEAWRCAMSLEQFDLVGHSAGGYLATQYALQYPTRVRRLVLLSPVGWASRPAGELAHARAGGVFGALWASDYANFGMAKILGRVARPLAQRAIVGRLGIEDEEEAALVRDYFWHSLCGQPLSGEQVVNYLFVPYVSPAPFGFYARRPVCEEPAARLAALPPTTLLYGSHDLHYIPTMPQAVKAVQAATRSAVRMMHVSHSDHHLYLDNPREVHARIDRALA